MPTLSQIQSHGYMENKYFQISPLLSLPSSKPWDSSLTSAYVSHISDDLIMLLLNILIYATHLGSRALPLGSISRFTNKPLIFKGIRLTILLWLKLTALKTFE